jgi:hypothetical protein
MSPWTPRQVRYLESSVSPLTSTQKNKMNAELHADPSLGHKTKGSSVMKTGNKLRRMEIEVHRDQSGKVTGHTVSHHYLPNQKSKSGAFSEYPETTSQPFGKGQHEAMMDHIDNHLGIASTGAKDVAKVEAEEPGSEGEGE